MRRFCTGPALCILTISLAGGVLAGAACGGSSSESPWPVEPDTPVLGPAGEEGATSTGTFDLSPDAGADAAPTVEP